MQINNDQNYLLIRLDLDSLQGCSYTLLKLLAYMKSFGLILMGTSLMVKKELPNSLSRVINPSNEDQGLLLCVAGVVMLMLTMILQIQGGALGRNGRRAGFRN